MVILFTPRVLQTAKTHFDRDYVLENDFNHAVRSVDVPLFRKYEHNENTVDTAIDSTVN